MECKQEDRTSESARAEGRSLVGQSRGDKHNEEVQWGRRAPRGFSLGAWEKNGFNK